MTALIATTQHILLGHSSWWMALPVFTALGLFQHSLDIIFWHALRLSSGDRSAESRVMIRIWRPLARSDDDLAHQFRIALSALRVLGPLAMLNVGPF